MYLYVKALHIIFVITWFAGLFYMVRLFVYSAEVNEKPEPERSILLKQFGLMQKRLWYGITWPSAILTLIFGTWIGILYRGLPTWLLIKLFFVAGLFAYHIILHVIFKQQQKENFKWTSYQLRIWNEVADRFFSCHRNAGCCKTVVKSCVGSRRVDCVFTSFVCCYQNLQAPA